MFCDFCGKEAECIQKRIGGQEFNVCEDCPVMNFTPGQIQIASMIDTKVQALSGAGCDDATIVDEMLDCDMPGVKLLMNTSRARWTNSTGVFRGSTATSELRACVARTESGSRRQRRRADSRAEA